MRIKFLIPAFIGVILFPMALLAQINPDSSANGLTLEQCIDFSMKNRPAVQQAFIDEEIGERDIKTNLAGWYPQITAQYNLQHYLTLYVLKVNILIIIRNILINFVSRRFQ